MIPPAQLKQWREACEKATPGKWELSKSDFSFGVWIDTGDPSGDSMRLQGDQDDLGEADARFIAISREAVPALLDEVDRLAGFEECFHEQTAELVKVIAERDALLATAAMVPTEEEREAASYALSVLAEFLRSRPPWGNPRDSHDRAQNEAHAKASAGLAVLDRLLAATLQTKTEGK